MASAIKINTLKTKIEFIILSLGGSKDRDKEENKVLIEAFEKTATDTRNMMKE